MSQNQIIQVTKEIVVKYIEMGKISPTKFDEIFKNIYKSVKETLSEEKKSSKN